MLRFTSFIAVAAGLVLQAAVAGAFPTLPAQVVATYPTATNLENCGTCHVSFDGTNAATNPYGAAYAAAGFSFAAIEGDDSDGDGTSNIDEINTDAGFFPGWTCETYVNAVGSPPADLADFVDPVDPGCGGGTTTTTTVTVTSTSTTTSTIPSGEASCADPVAPYDGPVATDCLFILNAAVGSEECADCLCDPIGSNGVNSTDALLCLNVSVGQPLPLDCPACNGTTTTSTTSTTGGEPTTTSTTVQEPTTTTTDTSTTSTTNIPG